LTFRLHNALNIAIKMRQVCLDGLASTGTELILNRAVLQFRFSLPKCLAIPAQFPFGPAMSVWAKEPSGFGHKHSPFTAF
jgi:hypothetical protein